MSDGPAPRLNEAAAIFGELVELEPEAMRARLAALETADPTLARLVRELVAADSEAGAFLEAGAAEYAPRLNALPADPGGESDSAPGQAIGPYVLVSLLGKGGMGEVWVAERRDGQFEQRVALKLLRKGIDSEGIRRRFVQERQVLARLDHPNIARLLDGGTADGRPYFVLELVEGEPITEFSRERRLPLEERLLLVAQCCDAVDAAHRRLVVHRDIKPSNVLVTKDGEVKLLDFGIAKVLSAESGSADFTQVEERVLTPSYAAPEQILGEPVTTATDVYALGVLLYRLLTGVLPHARTATSAAQLASDVESETIEKPSRAVGHANLEEAGLPPHESAKLPALLEDDLDAIVLKALRREPDRRYPGAAALGEDLRRHLAGLRVEARPDTFSYRAGKFVRRHRGGVAAAALVVLALVAGLAATTWQARVARANARRAERVQEFLVAIFQGSDPSHSRGESLTARELLADGTRRIESDLRSEPEVQADLYDALAQIQASLGALPEAERLAERALSERRRLYGARDPRAMRSVVTLAVVRTALAQEEEAEKLVRDALPVLRAAYGEDGDETLRARNLLVDVLLNRGAGEKALVEAEALVASRRRRSGADSPEAAHNLHQVGMIQETMSRYDDAEKTYRQAIAILDRTVGVNDPRAASVHASLAELLSYRGRRPEAEREFAVTLASQRKSLGANHPDVAATLIDLGFLYTNERRYAEADAAFEESLRIYRALGSADAANSLRVWSLSLMGQERYAEARARLDECLAIARSQYGPKNQITLTALGNLGDAELHGGDRAGAEATLTEAIAGLEELFGKDSDSLRAPLNNLGELRRLQGRWDEAEALHRRALAIQLKSVGPDGPAVPGTRWQIAMDLLGRPTTAHLAEARSEVDQALTLQERIDAEHPRMDEMLVTSAEIARAQGDRARARRELTDALERLRKHHGAADPRAQKAGVELVALDR